MPKFVIERDLPGAGALSAEELRGIALRSNEVLDEMAGRAQWVHSYVTDDKIFCVYLANDAEDVREHARTAPFPCDEVHTVRAVIDPVTADS